MITALRSVFLVCLFVCFSQAGVGNLATINVANEFSVLISKCNVIYCQIAVKNQIIVTQTKYATVMLIFARY